MKFLPIMQRYDGQQRGNDYTIPCPYHNEQDPSLSVDIITGQWRCFGCNAKGWIVKIVMTMEGLDYEDSIKLIEKLTGHVNGTSYTGNLGSSVQFMDSETSYDLFVPIQQKKYKAYIRGRGITLKMAEEYGLREGSMIEAGWHDRLVYPIYNIDGDLCSLEGRAIYKDTDERFRKWKGSKANLGIFGIDKYKGQTKDLIFIVEGLFDKFSIEKCGYRSVAMACSDISKQQRLQLRQVTKLPVVLLDGTKPSNQRERKRVLRAIKTGLGSTFFKYRVIEIPYRDTDPNDLLLDGKLKKYLRSVV